MNWGSLWNAFIFMSPVLVLIAVGVLVLLALDGIRAFEELRKTKQQPSIPQSVLDAVKQPFFSHRWADHASRTLPLSTLSNPKFHDHPAGQPFDILIFSKDWTAFEAKATIGVSLLDPELTVTVDSEETLNNNPVRAVVQVPLDEIDGWLLDTFEASETLFEKIRLAGTADATPWVRSDEGER